MAAAAAVAVVEAAAGVVIVSIVVAPVVVAMADIVVEEEVVVGVGVYVAGDIDLAGGGVKKPGMLSRRRYCGDVALNKLSPRPNITSVGSFNVSAKYKHSL